MELLAVLVVSALGLMVFWVATERDPAAHRPMLRIGLLAHIVSPQLLWWQMTSWLDTPTGDQLSFFSHGQTLLDAIQADPEYYLPQLGRLLASPSSTYVMDGLATVLLGVVVYPTAAIVVVSFFAYFGQLALYRALRDRLPAELGGHAAAACLMVPSADFWTSGLVKEALAVGGLGLIVHGAASIRGRSRRVVGTVQLLCGALVVAQTKAYVLFPLSAAIGIWWFWDRQSTEARSAILARPWRIAFFGLAVAAVVYGLSSMFPRFSPEQFAMEASIQRGHATDAGGGSAFTLSRAPAGAGLAGEIALAPLGLFNAIFRPFLFEARNALMVPAAIESTVLIALTLRGLLGPGPVVMGRRTVDSPILLACVVFVLMFATAVGLTTTNFGTMSRYRVPMLPFLVLWLLGTGRPLPRQVTSSGASLANPPTLGQRASARARPKKGVS